MAIKISFLLLLLAFSGLSRATAQESAGFNMPLPKGKGYIQSPYVDDEAWHKVQPYLLPYNHPIRAKLDKIFNRSRATSTKESLKKAGFTILSSKGNHVLPVVHPTLQGVILKVYTDFFKTSYHANAVDWKKFQKRLIGAQMIRDAITNNPIYKKHFTVAKKWLYPLPATPEPLIGPNYKRRNFLLVVEDLQLISSEDNRKRWKKKLKKGQLESLFFICRDLGLQDSLRPANTWWTVDEKLGFVDTEQYEKWPICFHSISKNIPSKLRAHLNYLINTHGQGLMY